MAKITRTIPVKHGNGHILGGLLHYVQAASNHAAKAYRKGARGKKLYRAAAHRTKVYRSRFADYIVRDVYGSHRSWRTHKLSEPHARALHYHNPVAQTDQFETAFDDTAKRWNGSPAIHVAIYGRGRPDRPWMAIPVPPFVVKRLAKPGVTPKTARIDRGHIYVTYEERVPDREPVMWAGVDMNAGNNTYAFPDGTTTVERNDYSRQYNRACTRILRVRRRGDNRVMAKYQTKAWDAYKNRVRDHTRKEARRYADAGVAVGYEELTIHRLTIRGNGMAPFPRGRQKTVLNTGQRKRAHRNAAESAGLPSAGVDPHGTSARCFMCGGKLKRSASWTKRERNMWCQPCGAIRERDCNAGANVMFRAIFGLVVAATGLVGAAERSMTLPAIMSLLGEAIRCPDISGRDHSTLTNIMRLIGGRSAGAEWHLPGAHKPGRQSPAGGEPVGGPGVSGLGRSGPGPPNAAKLCDYA